MAVQKPYSVSRRSILSTVPLVPLAALSAAPPATESAFSPPQLRLIEAFVDRLIPTDEIGPGARECGVATYINRSFAGPLTEEKPALVKGLVASPVPSPEEPQPVSRPASANAASENTNRFLRLRDIMKPL